MIPTPTLRTTPPLLAGIPESAHWIRKAREDAEAKANLREDRGPVAAQAHRNAMTAISPL